MSDTPRTDAFLAKHSTGFGMGPFTRDLERELAAVTRERDEARVRVLADVVEMLWTQHTWLTRVAVINLVAGLYGQADKVLALATTEAL